MDTSWQFARCNRDDTVCAVVPMRYSVHFLGGTMSTVEYAFVAILAISFVILCSVVFLYDLVRKYIGLKK